MKNVIILSSLLILCCSLGCSTGKNMVVNHETLVITTEQIKDQQTIDGDQLINGLLTDRFNYNKALIKHGFDPQKQIPASVSILANTPVKTISFNGLNYLIKYNKIIEIKGAKLSLSALNAITDKAVKLDRLQQFYCESANLAYHQKNRDLNKIKTLDRKYFAALRLLKSITSNIANEVKKQNASISIEMWLATIKLPDTSVIGMKSNNKGNFVAEVKQ